MGSVWKYIFSLGEVMVLKLWTITISGESYLKFRILNLAPGNLKSENTERLHPGIFTVTSPHPAMLTKLCSRCSLWGPPQRPVLGTLPCFPADSDSKEYSCHVEDTLFHPWVRNTPWRRKWQPTPVFFPGGSHGQRSLAGYSPRGCKESDMT